MDHFRQQKRQNPQAVFGGVSHSKRTKKAKVTLSVYYCFTFGPNAIMKKLLHELWPVSASDRVFNQGT